VFAFGMLVPLVFWGAYLFAFGIDAVGVVVVVVPGAVAGGLPGEVVVVVVVPVVDVPPMGACVAANAAPAPSAVSTTAKVAFLAAMFIEVPSVWLRHSALLSKRRERRDVPNCPGIAPLHTTR